MSALPSLAALPVRIALLIVSLACSRLGAATWYDDDVGYVGQDGSGSESGGVISIRGSGADVWGNTDGCHFRYFAHTGDGALVVRVAAAPGGHAWAKIGLMMREEIAPAAKAVMAYATPGNHVGLQARAETGYNTALVSDSWGAVPVWLMLDRQGDVFRAYRSPDGENWTSIGSVTVVMAPGILAGIAVSSHDNGVLQEATLDNFMQLGVSTLSAPTNLRVGWTASTSVGLAWTAATTEPTGYEIERAAGTNGEFVRVETVSGGSLDYSDAGLTPQTQYRYRVRAVGDGGASGYSNVVQATTPEDDSALVAPTDFRADLTTATTIRLVWTDNSDELGFELWRRVQGGGEYGLQGTLPADTTTFTDTGLSANSAYEYRLRAVRSGSYSSYAVVGAGTTPPDAGNWAGGDIGAVGVAGSTTVSSDGSTFTMQAGGGDMWGGADAFRIHYRQWRGDGVVAARVTSLTNTDSWAKAGVMIRATFDSTSPNVAMVLTAGNVSGFQARTTAGGATTFASGPRVSLPYWVAVSRAGNLFKGFVSPDGENWTLVGSAEIAMGTDVFVGLAACAHSSSGALTTAAFDHISVPDDALPPPPAQTWAQAAWGGTTGTATPAGADARLSARGGDIWGTSDSGLFMYREWTGDATLLARLDGFDPANEWTKAGLMIRASGDATAANVFVTATGIHGHFFQSRATTGAQSFTAQPEGRAGPIQWLKLVRAGNTFSGYYSTDDQATWTFLGARTVEMPAAVHAGVALASHNSTSVSEAEFAAITIQ